ncbi:MAG TPA: xanthine dehydrogenase family protein molybdopterin-binding subunit [Candidatus Binataceae bacterium]|nr:xanthine dehydrogenase family protein molybdopterin-binding subunit [Candidatus Binataceae bacterium]
MAAAGTHDYKVIGTRPIRHDGIDKVTGRAKYGADVTFADLLHGKVLRSPHGRARIRSINVEKALKLPGVRAVITGKDLPDLPDQMAALGEIPVNLQHLGLNILAKDLALYNGHAVAAVAATSAHIAEEALNLIEVDYEVLPPVMTVKEAMAPDAPVVLPSVRNPEMPDKPTNIASHVQFTRGDIKAGFAAADFVVERTFDTAMVHQGYIEPHNATGIYNSDGTAVIHTSTQGQWEARAACAVLLGMPDSKIRVVGREIGGGFGGKINVYLEPLAVLLSKKTGHPVKLVMSRSDVLRATGPTSGSEIRVKMGAKKDGRITAAEVWMAYEAGAFPGSPVNAGAMCILAPYDMENFLIDGYDVVVDRPKTAAYRAPGATNAAFACETIVDELAEKCGMDPIDFRLKNAAKEGTMQVIGLPFKRVGLIEVLESLKNSPHYKAPLTGKNRGRGVAIGFWFNVGLQSSATVNINVDGTASVVTGSVDIGGTRAASAMIAAEVLGLTAEDVRPSNTDTDSIGQTDVTGGSRTTFATGWAVHDAAQDALRQLKERAAKSWDIDVEKVDFTGGKFISKSNGVAPMTLKELATKLQHTGGPVVGRATVHAGPMGAPSFAGCIVDLEVDPETGKVQILRATVSQDAGRAIHPAYVEGQLHGGTTQGLGWALNEEYVYDDKGVLRNAGFLDYRIPTCLDMPLIESIIVEVPHPDHPLGVRGVGECSIISPPAAAANAIYRAVGVRMTELPMSPGRILKEIKKK